MKEENKSEKDNSNFYEQILTNGIKKENFYDIQMNRKDYDFSKYASINSSNLEKELQMHYKIPIKEKIIDEENFKISQDLQEVKKKKKENLEIYNMDDFHENKNENKSSFEYANYCYSKDDNNMSGIHFIDTILKNIQNDNALKSNSEDYSNILNFYENSDLKYNNNTINMHNNEIKNTIHIWYDNKNFSYSWCYSMRNEDIKNLIYNFCMNIVNDEFYLIRLEEIKEENLNEENDKNIERFYLNERKILFYKRCESYDYENLGKVKQNEQYLIKKKKKNYEKLENSLNFPEVLRAIEYTKEGSYLLKHTVFNIPHLRFFFLSKSLKFIKWYSSRKSDEESKIYFSNINSLEINNVDDKVFENYKIDILKKLSFSITYNNEKKKIILTCKSLREFNYWITSVRSLMFHCRKIKATKYILLSHLNEFVYHDIKEEVASTTLNMTEQSNKLCELKNLNEKDKKKKELESLKTFHLYNLISFPDYNVYQIKTKYYLLKEKLYKYRILIEEEIDKFQINENIKDMHMNNNRKYSKNIKVESIKDDFLHSNNNENNDINKKLSYCGDVYHEDYYKINSRSDNNNEDHDAHKNYTDDDNNNCSEIINLKINRNNIKGNMNTILKENVLLHLNDNFCNEYINEQNEKETLFKKNSFDDTTKTKKIYSLNSEQNLNINKVNLLQLENNNIDEDSNEFKLFSIIKIFNRIDEKLRIIQKNILEAVKILIVEESKQKRNEKIFSIDNFFKYTTDIYRAIENKLIKNEININNENIKFYNVEKNNNEIDKKKFNNSFMNIDNISNPSNESLLNMYKNDQKLFLKEKNTLKNQIIDSKKLIHTILFDMWLCEVELGNIEDIYSIYIYNSKKKNFLINFDGSKILKNISQHISTKIMKYINF